MSMPFMCGAAPSSFTVPVILPSAAALTVQVEYNNPNASTNNIEVRPATLQNAFIVSPFSSFVFQARLLLLCSWCWAALGAPGFNPICRAISFSLLFIGCSDAGRTPGPRPHRV